MSLRFTILGCGSSGGVPRLALGWGVCDPNNPKNRRRRTSFLVERSGAEGMTRILIDTSPDLREQLLDAKVDWVDAVLYTHEHADHTHGIDDLRGLFINRRKRVPVYLDERTSKLMNHRFAYCFVREPGSEYPPMVRENRMAAGQLLTIEGQGGSIQALPILQHHGDIPSLGFPAARDSARVANRGDHVIDDIGVESLASVLIARVQMHSAGADRDAVDGVARKLIGQHGHRRVVLL